MNSAPSVTVGRASIAALVVTLFLSLTAVVQAAAPAGLKAVAGDGQVTLTWNNPNNPAITGYQIRQRIYVNGAWTKFPKFPKWPNIIPGSDASTTSHVVSGLTNGVRYSFQIRWMVGKKGGKPSEANATPAVPPPPKPGKPTGLRTVAGNNQATLIWDNPNNAAITRYQYKQWESVSTERGAKEWTDIPGSNANTTSYVVRGLTNTSVTTLIYRFRIRAVAGPSVGPQSSSAGAIIAVSLAAPVVTATPGNAQVMLSWSRITDYITRYQIKQWTGSSEPANGWKDIPGSRSSTTSHVVRGLTNGVRYSFRIRAVATCHFRGVIVSTCSVSGTPSTPVSPTPVPGKPAVTPMPGDAQVTLSWSNPNDAAITRYQIKQWTGSSESGSWTDISGSGSSTTSHVVRGLTNGESYSFRIRAVAGTNVAGTPSDPVRAVLLDKPVVSASAGDAQVTLSWSDPNDASITRYQIKQWTGSSESGSWTEIWGSVSSTTSHVVGRLTNGVGYSFRIRAMVGLFPGVESDPVSAMPVPDKPAVTATPGNAQVTLSWSNPNDASITRYQIKQWTGSSESGSWADISGSGEDTTSHVVSGLTNGVRYSFRIRAMAGAFPGTPSDPVSETPAVQPDKPAVTATPAGDSLVRLSWSNPNDASITGYQIKRWTGSSERGRWTDILGSGKDTITYTVPGLTNGVRYHFRIRAMAGRVPGMGSDVASATPVADKPIVTATPGDAQVTLSWSNPNDASITGYQIKQWIGSSESGSWTDISRSGSSTTSHVVTGLTNGVRYSFRIRAMVGTVTRTPSDPVSATPVSPPVGLKATAGDSQVTLTWDNPNNPTITGYQLKKYRFTIETGFNEGSWTDIPGSGKDTTSYVVTGLTNGARYGFEIRAVVGSVTGEESEFVPVTLSSIFTITGTVTQGETLTADTSTISDPDGPRSLTFSYQWKRDDTAISSATGRTYTLTQADVGAKITVTVTWTDARGTSESLTSTATANVANVNESPTGAVTITGTATRGQTLTADTSTISDPDGPSSLTFSYQWKRDDTAISSATGNTYVLTQADVGARITVTVSWTDAGSTVETLTSAATTSVTNTNQSPTGEPTITGTVTQGQTLTADTSTIVDPDGPARLTFSYQWKRDGSAISSATGRTYTLTQADVGAKISVTVSWTDAGSTAESLTSAATANVANLNDAPTGAVTISGTATQKQTLTADTSGISDPDGPSSLTFSYQWKRDGSDISSATGRTYTLTQADVGKAISVTVSWTDAYGASESLTSAATAKVVNVNDRPTGTVAITGTPTQGQTLTADTSGISDPDVPDTDSLTFTYQWTRGTDTVSRTSTYTLTQADVGEIITVVVAYHDGGRRELFLARTPKVANLNDAPTGSVTLTGTPTQGQTLTAVTSTISDPDGPSNLVFSYQWKRDESAISSATGRTYTLTQADVGKAISVTVSWTDAGSIVETLTSAATANVANLNDPPTGAVTITGTATQGQTLTAVTSTIVDPDGPSSLTFTYQWKRGVTDISDATGSTYVLTQADVGAVITVTVSWTDAGSIVETLTSAATANVANLNDPPTGAVTISGTVTQGQELTAVTSTIVDPDGPSSLTFTYQWKRDGTAISSATSRTYVLTQADVGKAISVIVSWTDAGSIVETLTSAATANVANLNDSPTGSVTITGTVTQGQTLTADTSGISDPDGPASLTFTYQWKRDGSDISSATGRTYTLTQADVGKAISVIVSWTDAGSTAETLTSVATASVTNANDPPTGSVTITGTVTQGQTLTADTSTIVDPDGPASLTFSYQWKRDGSDISSATGRTYTLTQADVGKAISVIVSWADAGSTAETLTSAATANVANLNDSPTGSVTITGTVTQGQTLTADTSTIVDPDGPASLTFSYQWKRDGSDISSATGRTYTLTQADVGKAISVIVSWTDAGSIVETLTSAATANVANLNDAPTGSVTITGTVTQGQTLTADTSTIVDPDGPASLTFSYQWKRDGSDISGATGNTHMLTQADVGKAISVIVSWTDAGSTAESLTSAATANVANLNDAPTGSVTITGTVTQGQTLTADTSGISDPDGPSNLTFTYQWKRDGTDISSATSRTYILTQADVGKAITVIVSWTDSGGAVETLTSAATANVANLNDAPTGAVTISGTVTQGQTLTAVTSTIVDPDGPASLTFTYQWKRDGTDISSATSRTYILTQADVGKAITVIVSWTDAGSTAESLTSAATANVANLNDSPTGSVTITGTVTQGQTLTADTSGISDPDGPSNLTFSYQWKRDGTDISSATSRTYILTQADVGKAITVIVSWTDSGGAVETLTSAATANVANLNDAPTGAVTISGTVTQGQTLTAVTSTIVDPDGPASLTFTYQWKRDGTDISSATSRTYILTQADVGKAITVIVSWTDSGGAVETLTSAATANVLDINDPPTGSVTITGAATQGQTLTADTSTIVDPDGPVNLIFSYQWNRGGNPISSATGRTYTLTQADVGAVISVTVSWTDGGSTAESLTSAATANVLDINDPPTGSVTITGSASQGQTLIAATSSISDPDGPVNLIFIYQWKRDNTAISGATSSTYVLKQADVGATITVTVSWTDAGGATESLTSAATSTVTATSSAVTAPAAPVGLKVIARSGKVKFRWSIPNNLAITHYEYKQWTGNTEPAGGWADFTGAMSATTQSRSVRSLTDGTEYNFRIRAVATGNVTGAPSDVITVTPGPTPTAPGDRPVVTAVAPVPGDRQITLSWGNPNNADIIKYQIRRRGVPIAHIGTKPDWNAWSDIPGSDKDTISHVVTGLPTGVKYYFRIRAVAGDYAHGPAAYGPASSVIGVKLVAAPSAAPAAPPGPTSLTAVADSGQVTLTWDHPNNPAITSYQYKYWTGSPESGRWTDMPGSNADTTNSPPVTGLTNGTKYHFRIRVMVGNIAGVKSRSASATPATPPVQKASTQISAHARYRQVELIWRDPTLTDQRDTTISKYQIKYWSGNSETGDWSDISATINTRHAYYLVTGLTNNTTYSFRIRGLTNGFITTESNLVQATPLAGPPKTPARPQAVAGDSEVTLTWDNPNNPDITRYQILQWTGGGERGSWGDWNDIPGSDKDTTDYTVPGLTNGIKYSFRIRAVAGSVTGSQSPYTAVVIPAAPVVVPGGITVAVRDSVGDSIAISVGIIHTGTRTVDSVVPTTEDGGSYSFTVVLDTQPSANVTIAVSSSDTTEGTVDKNSLVFTTTNWNIPQTVTVTGQADTLTDGDQDYTIILAAAVSTDTNYHGIDPIDVAITNTDTVTATRRHTRAVTMGGFTIIGADPGSLGVEGDKIDARVTGTGIRLALPSDHRVTRATFSRRTPEQLPPPQAGVSFGAAAAYVDVDIDTPLPTSSKATVCLQRPAGMPDHAAVYHLADQDSEWEQLTGAGNQPGYICGNTQSFSPIVVGTRVLGFTTASIDDHIWTLGAALGELQLPEATNGDSTITYRLHPRLPAGVNFDAATRRIHGTPTQVHDTTSYTYTATATDGDTATLQFSITVEAAAVQQRARALDVVLSALGRTAATDAVDIISNRFTATAAARPEVTLGGTALTSAFDADAVARVKDTLTATDRQHWYARDTKPQLLRSAKQLLTQSNFAIPLTTADGDTAADWTLWGRAAASGFSSNRLDTDGELYSGYIGLERRFGKQHNALAGIAITHSDGDADYRVAGNFLRTDGSRGAIEGEVDLEMTSILPYIHYTPRAGTGIWGMVGIGRGEVELRDEAGKVETDVDLLLAAVGGRQLLSRWHGIDFALKSDAFAVQLKSDRKLRLAEVTGVARRARVALEMSSERQLSTDAVLRPSIEFGGRWDDGDADTGVGAEIGGGLEYRASGFSVAARGRYSFAHRQSGFEDWGGSLSLTVGEAGMQGHGQGLWLSFTPEWGNPTSGVQQTWNGISVAGVEDAVSATDTAAAGRLNLELGYGMRTRARGWQVTPYGGLSATDEDTRYRLGGHILANESMDLSLEGERRETADGDTEHGIFLSWKLQL